MFVNPLSMYAKIPMAFMNLYRLHHRDQASYTLAIAIAMSGILLVNIWSILLLVLLLNPAWLSTRPKIGPVEFTGLLLAVLIVEIHFVDSVQKRATRDVAFGARVRDEPPSTAIWYASISVFVLAMSTILFVILR